MKRYWRVTAIAAASIVTLAASAGSAAAAVPGVSSQPATSVAVGSAALHGTVNPHGLATRVFFQYGTTTAYGAQTPFDGVGAGNAAKHIRQVIRSLTPATTYHFRFVAQNASGTAVTGDRTFRTRPGRMRVVLAATPNPVSVGGPTTLTGTVTGAGVAGRRVQVQQRPFPFSVGFVNVGNTLVTDAQGRFSMAIAALSVTTRFRARVTDRAGEASPEITVGARAIVGTRVTRTRVRRGGRVHFSGTVRPSEPGRGIAIQKRRNGRWVTVAGTVLRARDPGFAVYGKTIRVRRGGLYRVFLGTGSGATLPNVGRTIRIHTRR